MPANVEHEGERPPDPLAPISEGKDAPASGTNWRRFWVFITGDAFWTLLWRVFTLVLLSLGTLFVAKVALGGNIQVGKIDEARGLVTVVLLIAIVILVVIVVLTILSSSSPDDSVTKRIQLARDVMVPLLGIFGTVVGFYFGSTTNPSKTELKSLFARMLRDQAGRIRRKKTHGGGSETHERCRRIQNEGRNCREKEVIRSNDMFGTPEALKITYLYQSAVGIYGNSNMEGMYPAYGISISNGKSRDANRNDPCPSWRDRRPSTRSVRCTAGWASRRCLLVANPLQRAICVNSPMLPQFKRDADGGIVLHPERVAGRRQGIELAACASRTIRDGHALPLLAEAGSGRRHLETAGGATGSMKGVAAHQHKHACHKLKLRENQHGRVCT